jgi:hypothetical protein
MLADENPGTRGSMCSLGVVFGGTLFAVLFGGLGYVLCDGYDRCWPQCFGQVFVLLVPPFRLHVCLVIQL